MSSPQFLLASQSPRRKELLAQIGAQFDVIKVNVPEVHQAEELAEDYVTRLSREKSMAGALIAEGLPVMGADTIVTCQGRILEKPEDEAEAVEMLLMLSGSQHEVLTSVAISQLEEKAKSSGTHESFIDAQGNRFILDSAIVRTTVFFKTITESDARRYWLTGEPKDKAGAYGIQGLGAVFVDRIEGCYSNVVGLPLAKTTELLSRFKLTVWNA